jgi:hypothetical protein
MDDKNATQVNPVSFGDLDRYVWSGYTFDLPFDCESVTVRKVAGNLFSIEGDSILRVFMACRRCKRLLPAIDFYGDVSPCKQCHKQIVRRWQKKHPDLMLKYKRSYKKKKREKRAGV